MARGDEFDVEAWVGSTQTQFRVEDFCLEINFLKTNFSNLLN